MGEQELCLISALGSCNSEGGPALIITHDHDVHLALTKFQPSNPQQIIKCHFGMQTCLSVKIHPVSSSIVQPF